MVYVDESGFYVKRRGAGHMLLCHMVADTESELMEMAKRIGLQAKWLQRSNSGILHFDVCRTKRLRACIAGAQSISRRELGKWMKKPK